MIKRIAPDLAVHRSAYGYNLNSKEPLTRYSVPVFMQNFIPLSISFKLREKYKKMTHKRFPGKTPHNETFLKDCINGFNELDVPVNSEALIDNFRTSNILYALGHLSAELRNNRR
jgi:hypothetical protein